MRMHVEALRGYIVLLGSCTATLDTINAISQIWQHAIPYYDFMTEVYSRMMTFASQAGRRITAAMAHDSIDIVNRSAVGVIRFRYLTCRTIPTSNMQWYERYQKTVKGHV
ncbi:hypothetical protein F5B17DRAFT_397419 [Nemania serpens]|nr:hypothetical protein F5B17DRAFT_397419 [Nemania serpens]